MSDGCIFCRIVAGDIPCHKLAENDGALAFLDIMPLSEGHTLVIPKKHAQKVHEMDDESAQSVAVLLRKVAAVVGGENYNVLQNSGRGAGQEVLHVHFHIIPKDASGNGLSVKWNAGETNHPQLAAQAEKFRQEL